MSDYLHCDINELVEEQLKDENANLAELAAKVAESLVDGRYSSRKVRWTLENPPGIEWIFSRLRHSFVSAGRFANC